MHPRTQIHFISHDRTCVKCENGQICRPDAIYIAHPGILCVLPCAAGGLHSGSSATCPWKSHKSHLIQCVTHFTPPYTSTIYSTRNAFTPAKHFKRIRSLIVRWSLCTSMLHIKSNGWGWGNMSKKRRRRWRRKNTHVTFIIRGILCWNHSSWQAFHAISIFIVDSSWMQEHPTPMDLDLWWWQ